MIWYLSFEIDLTFGFCYLILSIGVSKNICFNCYELYKL